MLEETPWSKSTEAREDMVCLEKGKNEGVIGLLSAHVDEI